MRKDNKSLVFISGIVVVGVTAGLIISGMFKSEDATKQADDAGFIRAEYAALKTESDSGGLVEVGSNKYAWRSSYDQEDVLPTDPVMETNLYQAVVATDKPLAQPMNISYAESLSFAKFETPDGSYSVESKKGAGWLYKHKSN